ncbi:uncharacterized protein VTP21DRAFT_3017 [Calcarisporiella thermophila]|uniref:uncharacterized protein n=1 Tax=Calcarisporiella thermophila TaxID=911321 RepID=UPI0037446F3B
MDKAAESTGASSEEDLQFMRLAVDQANLSEPVDTAYCVGAILVQPTTGHILSTGFSRELPGNTHAEECCFLKLSDSSLAHGATLYTTMEPCSLRLSGKRSCTDQILEMKVGRVVIGVREPPTFVNCEGVKILTQKGIEVGFVGELEKECLWPNRHVLEKQ